MGDIGTLRGLDDLGAIPIEMKTPLADAVIRQWNRIANDLRGEERDRDSIAYSVAFLVDRDVVLTSELLARLEAGETWQQILYPE